MCVLKVGDHALLYVADPMMRCRCPNSEGANSGLLGSPFTGSFCHSTLAISVDFRLLRASVKPYPMLVDRPDAKFLRSWAVTLMECPSVVLSSTYMPAPPSLLSSLLPAALPG